MLRKLISPMAMGAPMHSVQESQWFDNWLPLDSERLHDSWKNSINSSVTRVAV